MELECDRPLTPHNRHKGKFACFLSQFAIATSIAACAAYLKNMIMTMRQQLKYQRYS